MTNKPPMPRVIRAYPLPVARFDHLKAYQRSLQLQADIAAREAGPAALADTVCNSEALATIVRNHELFSTAAADPRIYAADEPAVTDASNMVSLPYLGTMRIRAYRDRKGIAWFVLTDVFKAMGAKYSSKLRKNDNYSGDLAQVKAWIVNTVCPEASGYRFVASRSERGMYRLLGCRPYEAARALRQWMTEVAAPILRTV